MAPRRVPALLLGLSLLAAGPAAAQEGAWYRQGVPEVLAPAPGTTPDKTVESFRARYRQSGSPRIAVFWMRRLSDRTVPETRTVERVEESVAIGAVSDRHTTSNAWGGYRYGHADVDSRASGAVAGHRTLRREQTTGPVADASEDWLPEEVSQTAQAALVQELRRAGVKVVDRAAILRLQGAKDGKNPQAIEAAALRQRADLIAEITAMPSAESATGVLYSIDVKDLRNGQVLTTFTTPAEPRAGATAQFTTKPGRGYVESRSGTPLGQEIAWQLMEQMGAAWRR